MLTLAAAPRVSAPSTRTQRPRRPLVVQASRQEGTPNTKGLSGIHDPIGWGQRGGALKHEQAAAEQGRQLRAAALNEQAGRSDQAAHPGSASVNRFEAANKEIKEVEAEKAEMRDKSQSDDEWEHMPKQQKWFMEAKALLYSWLKTGVEPL